MAQAGVTRNCGNCGAVNSANDQFCSNCGYLLAAGPADKTLSSTAVAAAAAPTMMNTVAVGAGRRVTGALPTGSLPGGRYRIMQLIGKGGFGAVYKASDERFSAQRVVAIKEMSDAQLNPNEKARAIQDFRHEANLLVPLSHPNLPNVSDFFEEDGKAYLAMEFINGRSLEKVQEDAGGTVDERTAMGWALQLCNVLNYLHTRPQPIIFRDMKPSNVILDQDGQIKLIDFGIARIFKALVTKDTTLLGSQGYAPLEQYGRGQSDARSDIYALGATLYDLLAGQLPADAPMRRVHPQIFVPPRQLNSRISPATEAIVLKAMADEPGDRYQSAAEMYQAIVASGTAPNAATGLSGSAPLAPPGSQPTYPYPTFQGAPIVAQAGPTVMQAAGSRSGTAGAASVMAPPPVYPGSSSSAPTPGQPRVSRRRVLIGATALVAAGLGGTGLLFYFKNNAGQGQNRPAGGTLPLSFAYSTEKADWLQAAIDAFNKSNTSINNKAIQLVPLDARGSGDARDRILRGDIKPIAWSPASTLELNQLNTAWKKAHSGQDLIISAGELLPTSLVFSPLVFAAWKQRADVLLRQYGSIDWPSIHTAVTLKNGWPDIGGQSNWGQVKLGQTRPDQSNSGLLSITLLAYAFYKEQRGLTVQNIDQPDFLQYFKDIQGAVTQFGRSSGTYLEREVIQRGPSSYDITITYESLVLTLEKEAMQAQNMPLQPFYPSLNIVSDHPFAILQGSWVSQEEQMAAQAFREFLLGEEQQRQALLRGFRPTNPNVHISDDVAGNPFSKPAPAIQVKADIEPQAQLPHSDVIDELLTLWTNNFGTATTSTS
ncbi:MAG: protein kinase [Chloroflexota bacterium]|nr:protein kinase [Chloroflexota bacterium]